MHDSASLRRSPKGYGNHSAALTSWKAALWEYPVCHFIAQLFNLKITQSTGRRYNIHVQPSTIAIDKQIRGWTGARQLNMCESIIVRHRCRHEEQKPESACLTEPKAFSEINGERIARLKGLPPPPLWWAPKMYSVGCHRLCPDYGKEKRQEREVNQSRDH